jgi:hypothetical protein
MNVNMKSQFITAEFFVFGMLFLRYSTLWIIACEDAQAGSCQRNRNRLEIGQEAKKMSTAQPMDIRWFHLVEFNGI